MKQKKKEKEKRQEKEKGRVKHEKKGEVEGGEVETKMNAQEKENNKTQK
jgi:hypothetical protein